MIFFFFGIRFVLVKEFVYFNHQHVVDNRFMTLYRCNVCNSIEIIFVMFPFGKIDSNNIFFFYYCYHYNGRVLAWHDGVARAVSAVREITVCPRLCLCFCNLSMKRVRWKIAIPSHPPASHRGDTQQRLGRCFKAFLISPAIMP